ncbi:DeoR/GlpR transcriptional regulator [Anaerococcus sp. AGMB00486]|uniref:DeoR/GlpR transcriptional regulator n=2 Tax=Anaerococcus TaxID=165779 RepID=A0ABX2N8X9_9FIRM|nr:MULTISPECIES: DeoR/GlpR family DNA-binding transcription regulator [Anaerococcus]MDY3006577.1 DeoR/GlpR family DNA-binding transcription regulator [Anaerococcus porci]MSS77439.1 DeoR/GlpR transcriptional regulator [Anaerococcus porci]NVF11098.1 DeoR/GlpR transcriptional regulator [Anaerococcus faecalis]
MLKAERQEKIIEILEVEHKVIASELSKRFDVSEDTIRRDLKELDNLGKLKRVHSGALKIGPKITNFEYRSKIGQEEKKIMAKKALPFIKENSLIVIDGGTTNNTLINQIPLDFKCKIITNSIPIAVSLNNHKNIECIVLGGDYDKRTMSNFGPMTLKELDYFVPDIYIMGVYNINLEYGVSVNTFEESVIKKKMSDISTDVLCMVTKDKLETVSNYKHTNLKDITYLITSNWEDKFKKKYRKFIEKVI